jgi:hypothetical protein
MAKRGQPTKYKADYARQAGKLCNKGFDDEGMADFFNVSVATISNWKNAHPEFLESLKGGKHEYDYRIERSLAERAMGYSCREDKIFNNGKDVDPTVVETTKNYPPDTTACIYWLNNRKPDQWRGRPEDKSTGAEDLAEALSKLADKLPD